MGKIFGRSVVFDYPNLYGTSSLNKPLDERT